MRRASAAGLSFRRSPESHQAASLGREAGLLAVQQSPSLSPTEISWSVTLTAGGPRAIPYRPVGGLRADASGCATSVPALARAVVRRRRAHVGAALPAPSSSRCW